MPQQAALIFQDLKKHCRKQQYMFVKIANVFFSKFLVSVIGFFIVIINAKQLGPAGLGIISLIVLSITYNQVVCGIIGGSSIMYLASRKPLFEILIPSYLWAVISSLIGTLVLNVFNLMPQQYATDVFLLSVLQAFGTIHLNVFIGLEKIKKYNKISAIQVVITLISLLFLFYVLNYRTVQSYIISMYLGFAYVFLESSFVVFPGVKIGPISRWGNSLKFIFQNSIYIQLATIVHLLNCRLSYFMLDRYMDKGSLGVYAIAVSIAESLWLISRSISVIQYSRVVNSSELKSSQELTLLLAKFSLLVTIAGAVVLVLLPEYFFIWLFGSKFAAIKHLLLYLLPGVVFIANSSLYVHYYAAIGKNHINTIGSSIGFVFTIICCFVLIPRYHLAGAALSSSISYLANSVFLIFLFKKDAKYSWKDFMVKSSDTRNIFIEARKIFT
jgi:O-antigen/teichoic acid export membrane protein